MTRRLRLVIFQLPPGVWVVRGLEHDLSAEAGTIGQAVRAVAALVNAHTDFDARHGHAPLSAFAPAAQRYWNAYAAGTAIPLMQLGVDAPQGWDVQVAFAVRPPAEQSLRQPSQAAPRFHVPHAAF
jgi:hypothetical protein